MKAPRPPVLLTIGQVAADLGLHPQTVRRLARAGGLAVVRVGRSIRVPASEVARFLDAASTAALR